ncbi:helix-turn-helix domain-containing protein [Adlercreutzia muris]|uniref:helix-turn-helix domain-containing protein n=1 Tax=Adlercreutzia muris TaxID=1796610 RepID=UPI003511B28D
MGIGENIRRLRRREGLSQAAFGAQLGVTKETVGRWESNRTFPRRSHIEGMVARFNVEVDDILSEGQGLGAAPAPQSRDWGAAAACDPAPEAVTSLRALLLPVYKVDRSGNGTTLRHAGCAYAPPDVARRHPASVFVRMNYREMTRLYPVGSLLLIDQRARPYNGCTVVALIDNATIVVRRYTAGNSTVVLSSWSYDAPSPDLILDKRCVRIIGVAVFFQASHDTEVP